MTFGSLFSGIGGMDLGLAQAGMECAWQIEIDRECHKELNKYWPEVPKFYDVRDFEQYNLRPVDLVAGGFPCQPHSVAGERKGEDDERNLWPDFFRVVQALRPRWVLAENVPGIRTTIADRVLADLEAEGYTCWPFVVGAWAVGAPHRRDRVWFVAYDAIERRPSEAQEARQSQSQRHSDLADCHCPRQHQSKRILGANRLWPARPGEPQHEWEEARTNLPYDLLSIWDRVRTYYPQTLRTAEEKRQAEKAFGLPVGAMGRAIDGLSGRLLRRYIGQLKRNRIHALGGLGNAVVPDVVEAIGRAIMEAEAASGA